MFRYKSLTNLKEKNKGKTKEGKKSETLSEERTDFFATMMSNDRH